MLELQLEGLFFGDGDGLAHDPFAAKLADNGGIFGVEELFQQGTLLLAAARNPINITFLGAVIERDVTRRRAPAENADLAHSLRANPANSQVCHTAIPETQARISDVFRGAEHRNARGSDAGYRRRRRTERYIEFVHHQMKHDPHRG